MTVVAQGRLDRSVAPDPHLEESLLAEAEHRLPASEDRPSGMNEEWRVVVRACEHLIRRTVYYKDAHWAPSAYRAAAQASEVIWPTWPTTMAEEIAISESPLEGLQRRWDVTISRLRDSAKWMAAVLGAALASVIPAAPLAHLGSRHFSAVQEVLGVIGLLCVNIVLLLVLGVLRPQSVSYADVQEAGPPAGMRGKLRAIVRTRWPGSHAFEGPLYRWKHTVEAQPDLYLPCGVYSLADLRQMMTIEEITLKALSKAREVAVSDEVHRNLSSAEEARAASLHELRTAAARVVTVGMYFNVRARSTVATYAGATLGFLGVVAVIAAVAWPAS